MRRAIVFGILIILSTLPFPLAGADEVQDLQTYLQSLDGTAVFEPGNPYLNPRFEVAFPAEVSSNGSPDKYKGTSVAPPTILFLDDTAQQAASTQQVVHNMGPDGTNALLVNYDSTDQTKKLILGQILSTEYMPYVWNGASGITFSARSTVPIDIYPSVHYGVTGTTDDVRAGAGAVSIPGDDQWNSYTVSVSVPDDAPLRSVLFGFYGASSGSVYFDDIQVHGSTFVGQTSAPTSELSDGYSVIVLPGVNGEDMAPSLKFRSTPLGSKYFAEVRVRDVEAGADAYVPVDGTGVKHFGFLPPEYAQQILNDQNLEGVPSPTPLRHVTDGHRMLFMQESAGAGGSTGVAAIYAYVQILGEDQHEQPGGAYPTSPAAGAYSIVKNQAKNLNVVDLLDYTLTPIVLEDAADTASTPTMSVGFEDSEGGCTECFDVVVNVPARNWIETTTLTVEDIDTGSVVLTQDIVLDGTSEYRIEVPGAPLGHRATVSDTIFAYGDSFAMDLPTPEIKVCIDPAECPSDVTSVLSGTELVFDASGSMPGEGATGISSYAWSFDDTTGADGAVVTHTYFTPRVEPYHVTLTITDDLGRSNTDFVEIQVLNRAPSVSASVSDVGRGQNAVISASAGDEDNDVASIAVKVLDSSDAIVATDSITGASGSSTVPAALLSLGSTYTVEVTAVDTMGDASETQVLTFEVKNLPMTVSLSASPAITDRLTDVTVTASAIDPDGTVEQVEVYLDGTLLETLVGETTFTIPAGTLSLGTYVFSAVATDDLGGTATSGDRQVIVRNLFPTASLTASATLAAGGEDVEFTVEAADLDSSSFTSTLDFGDGSTPVDGPVGTLTYAYTESGNYTVTLTVTDSDGDSVSKFVDVEVDAVAPTTTASTNVDSPSGWYASSVAVTLSADEEDAVILYDVNGGAEETYSGPISVTADGTSVITFFGTDAAGNVEDANEFTVQIDRTGPVMDTSGMPSDLEVVSGDLVLSASAVDGLSGMKEIRILINGVVRMTGTDTVTFTWDTSEEGVPVGVHDVKVEAEDVAGNVVSHEVSVIAVNLPVG